MRAIWAVAATAATGMILAPVAGAQPTENAIETIETLEAEGYHVVIDRVGSGPLADCVVTSVRNPQEVTQTFWVDRGGKFGGKGRDRYRELVTIVVSRSITVSLNCDV